jgi:hypothetical protein
LNAYEKRCQPAVLAELAKTPLEAFWQEGAGLTEGSMGIRFASPEIPAPDRIVRDMASKFYFHSEGTVGDGNCADDAEFVVGLQETSAEAPAYLVKALPI